jgi:hypothetical protein
MRVLASSAESQHNDPISLSILYSLRAWPWASTELSTLELSKFLMRSKQTFDGLNILFTLESRKVI